MNYGMRFVTLYGRQGSRPSPWKRNEESKMAFWGGLTNSCEKKRSEKQRRKGKIQASKCRVPKNSRDMKAFLSNQFKEMEENNRMGRTRDLFKKIRDTKGVFNAEINDRNGMDLTEAENIEKRWQEYTQELYKKILITQINMMV